MQLSAVVVQSIAAGASHSLAVTAAQGSTHSREFASHGEFVDMQLLSFGAGDEGQLGTGREVGAERLPVKTSVVAAATSPNRKWMSPSRKKTSMGFQ
jgi:alpha-tubulin suppressor-like RCC1 family protein